MYSHKKKSVFYSAKNLLFSHWISKQNLSFRLHYMYSHKKICLLFYNKNLLSFFILQKILCLILLSYLKPSLLQIFKVQICHFVLNLLIWFTMNYCYRQSWFPSAGHYNAAVSCIIQIDFVSFLWESNISFEDAVDIIRLVEN